MNISSEIFPTDGSNLSSNLFNNSTEMETNLLYFLNVLLGLPTNSYVIWLIVTGNRLAAEFFILNLAVCEIILSVESVFIFLSYEFEFLWTVVNVLDGLAITGHPLFHCLICVEHYLAVVHPVTFLKYKPLRYRVSCSVIIWMASFGSGGIGVFVMFQPMLCIVFVFAQFVVFFYVELFCCVAVLRALKQPGPGERGRERGEENHMKRRAFYLILITTGTMLILYAPYIILLALFMTTDSDDTLLSIISSFCFTLSGLVQPFFFLYRMGKLPFINNQ